MRVDNSMATPDTEIVSQHRVAAGTLIYVRGANGELQVRLRPHFGPERTLTRAPADHHTPTQAA